MIRLLKWIGFLFIEYLLMLFFCFNSLLYAQDIKQVWLEDAKSNIVKITSYKSNDVVEYGAGIIIKDTPRIRLIMTAYHVIEDSDSIHVRFYDTRATDYLGKVYERIDQEKDFALIYVRKDANLQRINSLEIVSDSTIKETDKVFTIGHPRGSDWYVSSGEIRRSEDILSYAFSRESVDPGNSGGGLFNEHFQLIGLVTHKQEKDGHALKIKYAIEILKNWGFPFNKFMFAEKRKIEIALKNGISKKWWLISTAGGVAVVSAIIYILMSNESKGDPVLPGPPNPPTDH